MRIPSVLEIEISRKTLAPIFARLRPAALAGSSLWYLAAIIPALSIVRLMRSAYCPLPRADEWHIAKLLMKQRFDGLTFSDLYEPWNGHRIVVPRFILMGMANLSDWNLAWELVANFVLAALVFVAVMIFYRASIKTGYRAVSPLLAFATSALVFSAAQADNWLYGLQLTVFANAFLVLLALGALARPRATAAHLAIAIGAAIAAAYSFASGLVLWGAALPAAGTMDLRQPSLRYRFIAVWVFAGVAIFGVYFYGLDTNAPSLREVLNRIGLVEFARLFIGYFFLLLGSPIASLNHASATLAGTLAGIIFAVMFIDAFVHAPGERRTLIHAASPGAVAIASALLISLGRCYIEFQWTHFGRYVTIMNLFWFSAFAIAVIWWRVRGAQLAWIAAPQRRLAIACLIGLPAVSIYAASEWATRAAARDETLRGLAAVSAAARFTPDRLSADLSPYGLLGALNPPEFQREFIAWKALPFLYVEGLTTAFRDSGGGAPEERNRLALAYVRLSKELVDSGRTDAAREVLAFASRLLPDQNFPAL